MKATLIRTIRSVVIGGLTFAVGVVLASLTARRHQPFSNAVVTVTLSPPLPKEPSGPCRIRALITAYPHVASLRSLDFKNLEYPGAWASDNHCQPTESFHLRRGHSGTAEDGMKLREISFGDLSGDGQEEAIVSFDELGDGSGKWQSIYVFALEDQRPRVIYVFHSGDRAEGGLRRAYARDGMFQLELWGPSNTLEWTSGSDNHGLCCPLTFTRTRYRWIDGTFVEAGEAEMVQAPNE